MYLNLRIKIPTFIESIIVYFLLRYRKRHYDVAFRRIPLTQGQYAIVDPEDYPKLNAKKWNAYKKPDGTFYAARMSELTNGKRKTIWMHREIMQPPDNLYVDHEDGEGLNNTKENLRIVTAAQNCYNSRKRRDGVSSKYKGVSIDKRSNKWRAQIGYKSKRIQLGYFDDEIEAAKAYDEVAKKLFGEFAKLNFI